jgi:hypothetical protein
MTSLFPYSWCGYEVPALILLLDLKGAIRLDRSEDMFQLAPFKI